MLTINSVRSSVASALRTEYPDVVVYDENVHEAIEPYMNVELLTFSQSKQLGGRYLRSHSFVIRYHSQSQTYFGFHEVAESLYNTLNGIHLDEGLISGSSMSHTIADGVLSLQVQYNFHVVNSRPEQTQMRSMTQEAAIK